MGIVVGAVALASVLAALLTFAFLRRRSKYSRSKFGKEILLARAISRPSKHDVLLCHYLAGVCKIYMRICHRQLCPAKHYDFSCQLIERNGVHSRLPHCKRVR